MPHCDICDISVPTEASMVQHCTGKKHCTRMEYREKQAAVARRSVFIRGFSPKITADDLKLFLSTYGNIENVVVDTKKAPFAIVEFCDEIIVQKLLDEKNVCFKGTRLVIKPRRLNLVTSEKRQKRKSEGSDARFPCDEQLLSGLRECSNVSEQLERLVQLTELTEIEKEAREEVRSQLERMLSASLSRCRVHLFGSSVNGYGTRKCDIDLVLDTASSADNNVKAADWCVGLPYLHNTPGLEVTDGVIQVNSLAELSAQDRVRVVKQLIQHHGSELYSDLLPIKTARCPVVKFTDVKTQLKCDMSINNRYALLNTQLIQYYTALNSDIRSLIYAIKHWAKRKNVAGGEGPSPRLTNYALMMLVFFYLESSPSQKIPTVEQLSDGRDVSLDEWCHLLSARKDTVVSSTSQNAAELLVGFFEFYSQLSLSSVVLCLRNGRVCDRESFEKEISNHSELNGFKMSPLSVQDPFVLDHNITQNVNKTHLDKLCQELSSASSRCRLQTFMDFSVDDNSRRYGFLLLVEDDASASSSTETNVQRLSFEVTLNSVPQSSNAGSANSLTNGGQTSVFRDGCLFIDRILTEILGFKGNEDGVKKTESRSSFSDSINSIVESIVEQTNPSNSPTSPPEEPLVSGFSETAFSKRYMASKRLWFNRKKYRKQLSHIEDSFAKEAAVSRGLETCSHHCVNSSLQVELQVSKHATRADSAVVDIASVADPLREFYCFFMCFKNLSSSLIVKH